MTLEETKTKFEAPISRWRERILPEWLDYNGHMNVAYFVLIFDHGTDAFYPLILDGDGPAPQQYHETDENDEGLGWLWQGLEEGEFEDEE